MSFQTGVYGNTFNQLRGLAIIYGGISSIVLGILMIWALVKSGQIESIDKNIKIIADWITSQKAKEGEPNDDERFLQDEQIKLEKEERYLAELDRKKKENGEE